MVRAIPTSQNSEMKLENDIWTSKYSPYMKKKLL